MNIPEAIQTARKAHQHLRGRPAGVPPEQKSNAVYASLKAALDELWTAAERHRDAKQIRRAVVQLTVDAEFFAGLSDTEGFRDPAEVWQQYSYIEQAMDSGNNDAGQGRDCA